MSIYYIPVTTAVIKPTEKWFYKYYENEVIGQMCAVLQNRGLNQWLFCHGFVEPDYRRQGVFTNLWQQRIDYVISQKPRSIVGWTNPLNRKFFVGAGFLPVKNIDPWLNEEIEMRLIVT